MTWARAHDIAAQAVGREEHIPGAFPLDSAIRSGMRHMPKAKKKARKN
jgi:hypothetical protein